ncbi:zinc finger domain-containing protein [Tsukamurella ocularis]
MTITAADAARVQMLITVWHTRTALRADDQEAAMFVAEGWARAMTAHGVTLADALAGIEARAMADPKLHAPELAEVITAALAVRSKRTNADIDARALESTAAQPDPFTPDVLAIPCPECHVPPGERCVIDSPTGQIRQARRPCRDRLHPAA